METKPPQEFMEFPLSYGQKALWLLYSLSPSRAAYNVNFAWRIHGKLNPEVLQHSIEKLVERHPSLRTTYSVNEQGEPVQRIHTQMPLEFDQRNISAWSEDLLYGTLRAKTYRPFNLEKGPLSRWSLLTHSEIEHTLFFSIHHIATDMWSIMILLNELSDLYSALTNQTSPALPVNQLQYTDFVQWQQKMLKKDKKERQWKFWQKQLSGELPPLNLPTDKPRPPEVRYQGDIYSLRLPKKLTSQLEAFAKETEVTLFTLYLAAYYTLLHRYTGQDDILVGTPTAGRSLKYKNITGYFVSPNVLRANFPGNPTFQNFLQQTHQTTFATLRYRDYPFPLLVEKLQPERDPSRSPLTQVSFVWNDPNLYINQNNSLVTVDKHGKEIWRVGDLSWERLEIPLLLHDFDLMLTVHNIEENVSISLEYNTDLFEKDTIVRMAGHFRTLLEGIAENPDQPLSELPLLTAEEKQQILVDWNNTYINFPLEACAHQWFEHQVEKQPEAIAVIWEQEELSYHELNRQSSQLAHYLHSLGVGPDTLVGICMERSLKMIIALYGILKAGGAYVPLDPNYPQSRLNLILEDAQGQIVLSQESLKERLPDNLPHRICLDTEWEMIFNSSQEYSSNSVTLQNLSHIIYTSGSTGRPKGVAIEHHSVSTLINWSRQQFSEEELSGVCASTSLNFDLSVFEIFVPLALGGTIILTENALHLSESAAADKVRLINTVPSAIKELLGIGNIPPSVSTVNLAGEPLKNTVIQQLYQLPHIQRVLNLYGPSEDTTYSTFALMERGENYSPLIGRPLSNTLLYVLSPELKPVPVGVPGELYIGGDGLARGYFNRPDLTAEKFIPNPFDKDSSSHLYKTGDLVRYLPDGNLDFISRLDHQVKIRGFRIELQDIETTLYRHTSIHEAIVMDKEDSNNDKFLVAYVTLKPDKELTSQELREFLQTHLPEYMVPTSPEFILILDAMPLTPNGKIDRKALPSPKMQLQISSTSDEKPHSEVERVLLTIWEQTLHRQHIGVHENFFDLGGHSLLLARVYASLPEFLKQDLSIIDLFKYPTIHALTQYLEKEKDVPSLLRKNLLAQQRQLRDRAEPLPGMNIAVIGIAGRFPGANNPAELWENLKDSVESISEFSKEELNAAGVTSELLENPHYVSRKGTLNNIQEFDARFFGFTPREAQITDPQQRLFLECAWEALEDAGYIPDQSEVKIGVYAGSGMNHYLVSHLSTNPKLLQTVGEYPIMIGNDKDFLCSRVSYRLNLTGPSVVIQTACSTSLVAIHKACLGLLNGDCNTALAGGVSLGTLEKSGYLYQEGMILSPDGHCRAFDAKAKGTVAGQGAGLVVLKRLDKAEEDGDHIYAVIKGSAINNDGALKVGYTAPGVEGQAKVIQAAQSNANMDPETITYIETHGTATPLGDPIEISALTQAFEAKTTKKQFCAIGSVKTNIGHLDTAAGMAGLIKTIQALKHKQIPPTLHYEAPNPQIDFMSTPFFVNTELKKWKRFNTPRRAGVSSFGIGGTNAHIVLEEAPIHEPSQKARSWRLICLSAKTTSALETMTANFVDYLKKNADLNLSDIAYTLQIGRKEFQYRRILVCQSRSEAVIALEQHDPKRVFTAIHSSKKQYEQEEITERPITFMFPGQGSQYLDMGLELYRSEPIYREEIDRCEEILRRKLPDIYGNQTKDDLLFRTEKLHETFITQPALFMIEYALSKLLMKWGIVPTAMIGHSIGEYVAACLSGVFSLEDALYIVGNRGWLMQTAHLKSGDMLSIRLGEEQVVSYLNNYPELDLAAVNSPSRCVVSGVQEAIHSLHHQLKKQDIPCHRLHTSHGFHSQLMEPVLPKFREKLSQVTLQPPQTPFISTTTGNWIQPEEATSLDYWVKHLRQTVRFSQGLSTLFEDKDKNEMILLEVGSGRVLETLARQHPKRTKKHLVLSTTHHPQEEEPDQLYLLTTLGRLWLAGMKIDWKSFHVDKQRYRVPLPTYPFERKRYWVDIQESRTSNKSFDVPLQNQLQEEDIEISSDEALRSNVPTDYAPPKDSFERILAEIWKKFIGIDEIGIHDDFFELGGDSLTAVGLTSKIQEAFDVPIASHLLLQKRTISSLAEFIRKNATRPQIANQTAEAFQFSSLFEIQQGNPDKVPLFLISSISGEIFFYHNLAHYLDSDQPLYAFQTQKLSSKAEPFTSIPEMAAAYIEELKQFRPGFPYLLGGFSFGGIVAYEIAQQLLSQGHKVPLLVLTDTPDPQQMRKFNDSADILQYLFSDILEGSTEKLREMSVEEQLSYLLEKAKRTPHTNPYLQHINASTFKIWLAHQEIALHYEPQPYSGHMLFFRHTERMESFPANPHIPWIDRAQGGIEIYQIPGNHFSMNSRPHVKTMGKHLQKRLLEIKQEEITPAPPTSSPTPSSLLVEIQSGNSSNPRLFLIHPGGGHLYFYHDIVRHFGKDQPIFGIQAQGLDGQKPPFDKIEDMAACYLKELQNFQPNGPYILGGSSFGGIVAFEMALQLHAQGQKIPLLLMIDSPGPGHLPKPFEDDAELLAHLFGELSLSLEELRARNTKEQIDYVRQQAEALSNQSVLPPDFGEAFLKVVNAHQKAMFSYHPQKKYSGGILFFRHTEPMKEYDPDPEKAWLPFTDKLEIKTVAGNHITMNFVPHVQELVKYLQQRIIEISKFEEKGQ